MEKLKVGKPPANEFCDFTALIWTPESENDGADVFKTYPPVSLPLFLFQLNFDNQSCLLFGLPFLVVAKKYWLF